MGRTKDTFMEQRQRELQNFEPFDHDKRFEEKQEFVWFTTENLRECLNMDLNQLTETLIKFDGEGFKIDYQDRHRLIELIDKKEPFYIGRKQQDYFELVIKSPIDNIKRVFKKYSQDDQFNMMQIMKVYLESRIKRHGNSQTN